MNGFERIREGYNLLSQWYSNGKCLQIFPFKNFLQIWDLDILNNLLQTASYDSLFVWFKQTLHNWSLCGSHWLIFSCTNILHRGQLGKLHCISKSEIILAKKWWWALKMGQWPISHSNFQILTGLWKFSWALCKIWWAQEALKSPLEHNWHEIWIAYTWGPAKNI